tara:strand:- start:1818 stop:2909 length:1092 start_codon:yes stop_codon:yes gene_type:complete
MITLNEIAYNIKNLAYGGKNSTENNINILQVKHWIHYHRAKLIADNIDKGITNNQALYQSMSLTAKNSTSSTIKNFYDDWHAYDMGWSSSSPTISGELLSNYPRTSSSGREKLSGEWLAHSSLSIDSDGNEQSWQDAQSRSQYGDEIHSSQVRGDFRNFGWQQFWTPRPLQLKNDEGIKKVTLNRYAHFPDDPLTVDDEQGGSFASRGIRIYRQDHDYAEYNKFTNTSKPYYSQYTSRIDRDDGYGNYNYIFFGGLQVSPNYHGGLKDPANKKMFWKYRAAASMILENPTEIDMMGGFWYEPETNWDDNTTPYPIPMEYVSDLIQRVIQVEIQTELKTMPDVVTDGIDDITKLKAQGGAQAQR